MALPGSGSSLWVFGYGSLCWNPGFEYERCVIGRVRGWSRKFWQGNSTHRGTEGKPGRVATMVEEEESEVWGCAFLVRDEYALPYLCDREVEKGGYRKHMVRFHPRLLSMASFPAVLYIATPDNRHWLGDAPLLEMARQIASCCGPSGHNVEYVLRIADFVRRFAPESDAHLFELERLVVQVVEESRQDLVTLMGPAPKPLHCIDLCDCEQHARHQEAGPSHSQHDFTATVPSKKLRCLNM